MHAVCIAERLGSAPEGDSEAGTGASGAGALRWGSCVGVGKPRETVGYGGQARFLAALLAFSGRRGRDVSFFRARALRLIGQGLGG